MVYWLTTSEIIFSELLNAYLLPSSSIIKEDCISCQKIPENSSISHGGGGRSLTLYPRTAEIQGGGGLYKAPTNSPSSTAIWQLQQI